MNVPEQHPGLSRTLVALAVLAAFGAARAEDETDVAHLTAPGSSVSVGLGLASGSDKDRARFGQYNGLRDHSVNGLLGFEYLNHDNATGRWTTIEGRNLGLDNRELGLSVRQLGDWKFTADYSELVRHDPRTINTGLQGAGTSTPAVNRLVAPGTGSDLNLELKRKSISFAGHKWLNNSLQFEASFKNEDKDGARLFGRGFNCPSGAAPSPTCTAMAGGANAWALLLLPEPINSNIKQAEARLNFSGEKFLLSGGYYGSFYTNANSTLTPTVPGTLNNPLGVPTALNAGLQGILQLPMALPPDNQAHQFYVDGNYRFTPTTNGTFKYAYTHATQNDNFLGNGLIGAPAGRSDLDGRLDTNLAQLGLTARPLPKLFLLANLRYNDKDDKTPIALYNIEGANTFTNGHNSLKKINGKLEGTYQLPASLRATLGVDYESKDRDTFVSTNAVAGLSGLRQKTDEVGYRAELRRSMSETLTGAIGYRHSMRDGSTWLRPNSGALTGVTPVTDAQIFSRTAIFPFIMEDRKRDMLKLSANWSATDRLSLQFMAQGGRDSYNAPTTKGLRDTSVHFYNVDAVYALSPTWKFTAYASHGEQTLRVDHSTGYQLDFEDTTDSLGFGIAGKASSRLQLGGDFTYINERNKYDQTLDRLGSAANAAFLAANGLPDVTYRLLQLKLYGEYAVQKNAYVRVNFIHYRSKLNEWTWGYNGVPFSYSDNTTVTAQPNQNVSFIGVSYVYRFQ
jgi:MtrB/PioB family decaheme-associated outer membrane protein